MFVLFAAGIFGVYNLDRVLKGMHAHREITIEMAAKGLPPNITQEEAIM